MHTHAIANVKRTTWRLDPGRSSVEFHAKHLWGLATVKGRFDRYEGALDLTDEPAVELTVEADSLDSGNGRRDRHLRSADFFDVQRHPFIRFVSDDVVLEGERLEVRGRLHARGAATALEVVARLERVGDELEIEAVAVADHDRLGMTWNLLGMLHTPSTLIVKGRLVADA
jgi:polyisoprenoid-binding protein YceI